MQATKDDKSKPYCINDGYSTLRRTCRSVNEMLENGKYKKATVDPNNIVNDELDKISSQEAFRGKIQGVRVFYTERMSRVRL